MSSSSPFIYHPLLVFSSSPLMKTSCLRLKLVELNFFASFNADDQCKTNVSNIDHPSRQDEPFQSTSEALYNIHLWKGATSSQINSLPSIQMTWPRQNDEMYLFLKYFNTKPIDLWGMTSRKFYKMKQLVSYFLSKLFMISPDTTLFPFDGLANPLVMITDWSKHS